MNSLTISSSQAIGQVYIFPACAIDSKQIRAILVSVQDTILRSNLIDAGFV